MEVGIFAIPYLFLEEWLSLEWLEGMFRVSSGGWWCQVAVTGRGP